MATIILWYLIATLLGVVAFPLSFRFLRALPDRGYAVSRGLGLLLWGYAFWILATLKLLTNQRSVLLLSLLLFGVAGALLAKHIDKEDLRQWWRSHRGYVIILEILFFLSFAGWAVVRGTNPEAVGTEKPMELAFINGILASPSFPPHDPWLSGYSISYYYFGYILVAMLAKLSGTSGALAFNLGISLVFGLSAIGAFGLLFNLLSRYRSHQLTSFKTVSGRNILLSLFGPLFVLIVSNLEGFLQVLHDKGVFWVKDETGQLVSSFWTWLDIKDLNRPPSEPFSWLSTRFWWWWRASRVVQDYDLAGNPKEIIDEFPFFSYLLADLHPHVLAMPFAFLAMTLAFNFLLNTEEGRLGWFHRHLNRRTLAWCSILLIPASVLIIRTGIDQVKFLRAGFGVLLLVLAGFTMLRMWNTLAKYGIGVLVRNDLDSIEFGRAFQIEPQGFLLSAIILGCMAFLNTWDFPLYVGLFAAAYTLNRLLSGQTDLRELTREFVWLSLCLGLTGIVLFVPFYLGFSSQVGGIIPNLIYVTRGAHLWVMFTPLLIPILVFLIHLIVTNPGWKQSLRRGFSWALATLTVLWALSMLLGALIVSLDYLDPNVSQLFQATLASPGAAPLFLAAMERRLTSPGGWLTLLVLSGLTLAAFQRLFKERLAPQNRSPVNKTIPVNPSIAFALLLILFGVLLVVGPEFFYLQDQFGWRMNTIFKFYYQAWLIWGIAAAFSSAYLLINLRRYSSIIWRLGLVFLLAASLIYPVYGLWSKTNGLDMHAWTLDSSAYLEMQSPEILAAASWLRTAHPGALAEAVPQTGGSYSGFAILSTLTGMPTVLGWFGHESQWRGSAELLGPRQADLATLFCSRDWEETHLILERYQIRYVVVGNLEREAYMASSAYCPGGLYEAKFQRYLNPVFQSGQLTIYEYYQLEVN